MQKAIEKIGASDNLANIGPEQNHVVFDHPGRVDLGARQLVNHGHFMLNERGINVPSTVLKPGDKISLREKSSKLPYFKMLRQAEDSRTPTAWVESDLNNLTGRVIRLPERAEIDGNLNEQLIVEFYSR